MLVCILKNPVKPHFLTCFISENAKTFYGETHIYHLHLEIQEIAIQAIFAQILAVISNSYSLCFFESGY